MKLKDLRPILTAIGVNLYLEYKKPIEFVSLGDGDYIKNNSDEDEDTMYKEYGE